MLAFWDWEERRSHFVWPPATARRFILSRRHFDVQLSQKTLSKRNKSRLVSWQLWMGTKPLFVVESGITQFRVLPQQCRRKTCNTWKKEEINIPPDSMFIVYGYVEHEDGERHGKYRLPYPMFLIAEIVELKNAIGLAPCNSLIIAAKAYEEVASTDSVLVVEKPWRIRTDTRS